MEEIQFEQNCYQRLNHNKKRTTNMKVPSFIELASDWADCLSEGFAYRHRHRSFHFLRRD